MVAIQDFVLPRSVKVLDNDSFRGTSDEVGVLLSSTSIFELTAFVDHLFAQPFGPHKTFPYRSTGKVTFFFVAEQRTTGSVEQRVAAVLPVWHLCGRAMTTASDIPVYGFAACASTR
jgi:hypothetical protein